MSGKPYHVGHDAMVRQASKQCDRVLLFVSTSDRARPGETPILGKDMEQIWKQFIQPTLPRNVEVAYGGSPVGHVWKALGKANEDGSEDTYVIFADAADLAQNFTENLLKKYCGNLFDAGQVKLEATERAFSGTQMRAYLSSGDKESFIKHLPSQVDGEAVWNVLYATAKNPPKVKTTAGPTRKPAAKKGPVEGLLRRYVRLLLDG